jgi:3-dehydroquinate synthase
LQKVRVSVRPRELDYNIQIGRGMLWRLGEEARRCLSERACRLAIISNKRVFTIYGPEVIKNLRASGFNVSHWLMGDGERFKSLRSLEKALAFLGEAGLERNDGVVALGGGVVGDLAGFAAAVYLRGVPLIQVPTTLLAQIDSSGGGKTGVNLKVGKNLVGAFKHPRAVIIDTQTLKTLPSRELTAGWCEAVKQGAAGSRSLFDLTTKFLSNLDSDPKTLPSTDFEKLLAAQCAFKASIVASDEREDAARIDHRSRRILNFGHTTAHALEAATNYRRFRHGEAVGYGMLVAGEISKTIGLLQVSELELLRQSVRLCGPLPVAGDLDESKIIERLGRDKKSIGGRLHWVLLERIGRARIVNESEITPRLLRASLRATLRPTSDRAIGAI